MSTRGIQWMRALAVALVAVLVWAVAPTSHAAGGPAVRFITVSDATPRSFTVVWLSSDPGEPTVRLFEAPDCQREILNAEILHYPTLAGSSTIAPAAQLKGIMVVKVADLSPDAEYCVQTVTTSALTNGITTAPSSPLRVRTQKKTIRSAPNGSGELVPFANDLARVEILRDDPDDATTGTLVLVKVRGAATPLMGFIGDGITDAPIPGAPTGLALVNLNNLYEAGSGESMELQGDGSEEISTWVLGGPEGFVTVQSRVVPPTRGLAEVAALSPCPGLCDGRLGDTDNDSEITLADAAVVANWIVGVEPVLACPVCADVTWDFTVDMKDTLAVAQAAAILRPLPW